MHDSTSTTERARRSVAVCSAGAQSAQRQRPQRRHANPCPHRGVAVAAAAARSPSSADVELDAPPPPTHVSSRRTFTARPARRLLGDPATASPGDGAGLGAGLLRVTGRRLMPLGASLTTDGASTYSLREARSTTMPSIVRRPADCDAAGPVSGKGHCDRGTTRTGEVGRGVVEACRGHRATGTTCINRQRNTISYYAAAVGTRLPAAREVPESNRAADKNVCVFYRKSLQYAALGIGCTLTAVPRSTQPSILRGTVNEYQPYGDGRMFGL